MNKLILWDIDGTLLSTHGAGVRAMRRAGAVVFGGALSFEGVVFAGNLDPLIVAEAAQRSGLPIEDHHHASFLDAYRGLLHDELSAAREHLRVMPGVRGVLAAMRADPGLTLGLLTGNYGSTAGLKLSANGIDPGWFPIGAFGDDAPDRPSLVPVALRRYEQVVGAPIDPRSVYLIGDTPRDIHAAKSNGCIAIAVATGSYDVTTLRDAGANLALESLEDPAPLWVFLHGVNPPATASA